jgi:hypothetical protein
MRHRTVTAAAETGRRGVSTNARIHCYLATLLIDDERNILNASDRGYGAASPVGFYNFLGRRL